MDQISAYGEADKGQASPPKESGPDEVTNQDTSVALDLAKGIIPGGVYFHPRWPSVVRTM